MGIVELRLGISYWSLSGGFYTTLSPDPIRYEMLPMRA